MDEEYWADKEDGGEEGDVDSGSSERGLVAMGAAMHASVLAGIMQCCGDTVENRNAKCMPVWVLPPLPLLSRMTMGRVKVPRTCDPQRYFASELKGSTERPT